MPHPDSQPIAICCAIVTVSDTRNPETDRSGQLIRQMLEAEGHSVRDYALLKDEPSAIEELLYRWSNRADVEAVILNGGTGIAPRDTTYDAIEQLLDKTLPGFGELFRMLSYAEVGSRAMASRAIAGVCHSTLIFSLPGSTNAVRLAMEKLILPELRHLVTQLNLARQP
ncbi:MAG TPA: MogA/MoaB family molybdenum cofactor biosynthesis protein [Trichocoleus sp.]|jgi:molybdenum cofactor biosynthesis protein B